MNFNLTKKQELFRQMIREFAEKEVKPLAVEIDEQERFPMETIEKMAKIKVVRFLIIIYFICYLLFIIPKHQ